MHIYIIPDIVMIRFHRTTCYTWLLKLNFSYYIGLLCVEPMHVVHMYNVCVVLQVSCCSCFLWHHFITCKTINVLVQHTRCVFLYISFTITVLDCYLQNMLITWFNGPKIAFPWVRFTVHVCLYIFLCHKSACVVYWGSFRGAQSINECGA